jgi:putative addiction module killer protein
MIEVRTYIDALGRRPFATWLDGLSGAANAKVQTAIARMELGNLSNVRSVGSGLSEYRIHFGPGYRIYFGRDGDTLIILLGGGTKQRQQRDIEAAKALWQEYRQRKRRERWVHGAE